MCIKYLSVDHVHSIHETILKNTVEDKGLSPDMSLDSAINRIHDHVHYDGVSDIYEIAALYAIAIAKGHCFNNGNKRTGMVSMVVFLFTNDIIINISNEKIENIMVDIVEDKINQKELAKWLKINSRLI